MKQRWDGGRGNSREYRNQESGQKTMEKESLKERLNKMIEEYR